MKPLGHYCVIFTQFKSFVSIYLYIPIFTVHRKSKQERLPGVFGGLALFQAETCCVSLWPYLPLVSHVSLMRHSVQCAHVAPVMTFCRFLLCIETVFNLLVNIKIL